MSRFPSPDQAPPAGRAPALAAVGAAALAGGLAFGTPVLLPLGIGLLAVALLAAAGTALAARGARAARSVEPARVPAGGRTRLTVRVRTGPVRAALLRALETGLDPGPGDLPAGLARHIRRGRGPVEAAVWIGPLPRGLHVLPDPELVVADPFGIAARRRRLPAPAEVVALAPVVGIAAPFWERAGARASGAGAPPAPQGWYELDGVREYQPGDPLSRIHWGQTARRGKLQTKEMKGAEGRGGGVLVLLDCREADAGREDDFELAVSAAASLAHHLEHRGEPVALEMSGAVPLRIPAGSGAWPQAEDALARVAADGARTASAVLRGAVAAGPATRTVVLVSATPDAGLPGAVRQAAAARARVAVVLAGSAAAGLADTLRGCGAAVSTPAGTADLAAALSAHRPHEGAEARAVAGAAG